MITEDFINAEKTMEECKAQFNAAKRLQHIEAKKAFKNYFRLADILFILAILMNFGAVVITNAMVVKSEPDLQLYEVNPTVRDRFNYSDAPVEVGVTDKKDSNILWKAVSIHIYLITVLISFYLAIRLKAKSYNEVIGVLVISIVLFILLGWDFNNDLGYWIGMQIWG